MKNKIVFGIIVVLVLSWMGLIDIKLPAYGGGAKQTYFADGGNTAFTTMSEAPVISYKLSELHTPEDYFKKVIFPQLDVTEQQKYLDFGAEVINVNKMLSQAPDDVKRHFGYGRYRKLVDVSSGVKYVGGYR